MNRSRLYKRTAELEIKPVSGASKTFSSPPFRIDFETEFDRFSSTKIKLYNPNQDTIDSVASQKIAGELQYAKLFLTAGYEDSAGVVVAGSIYKYSNKKQGADRILELQSTEQASSWSESVFRKNYKDFPAQLIILDILEKSDILIGKIELKNNILLNYTSSTLKKSVDDICRMTESEFYFKENRIYIQPVGYSPIPSQILLDYSSGLIDRPEKIENKKWKIKSLFRHEFRLNQVLYVKGGDLDSQIKIIKGKSRFSSHADSNSDFEGVEV